MENRSDDYQDNMNPAEDYDRRDEFLKEDIYTALEEKWYGISKEYGNRYTSLTDEDLSYEPGRFGDMLDRIGDRRGKTRMEIREEIERW
jgi:hypothetical protein